MRKRIQWALMVVLTMISPALYALGLGSAKVNSFLNQPLDVRVELISQNSEELQSITVGLAAARDFELLGLQLNSISVPLEFEIVNEGNKPYIHITSRLNVSDPVMQILLEVVWANGRMLREYTLFLDPPTLGSKAPAPTVSQAPATSPVAPTQPASVTPPPTQAVAQADRTERAVPEISNPVDRPETGVEQQRDQGNTANVAKGQTLWGIASEWSQGTGYSVNQAMLAIQRKNPDAFIDGNINLLKQGEILRMPASNEMAEISSQQAALEVLRQAEDFNSAPGLPDYDTPTMADSGYQDSSAAADALFDEAEDNEGRLELVPPSDSTDDAVGAISQASDEVLSDDVNEQVLQEKLSRTEEDLVNAELENNYLKERISELEQAAEEAESVQVTDADLAAMESELAEKLASNEPQPKIAITPGGEKEPWYAGATIWILAGVLFLILMIVWFLRRRSRLASASQQEIENRATVQAVAEEAEDLLDILDNYGASASTRKVTSHSEDEALEVDLDDDLEVRQHAGADQKGDGAARVMPVLVPVPVEDEPEPEIDEPAIVQSDEPLLDEEEIEFIEDSELFDESADIDTSVENDLPAEAEESSDPELKLDLARAYLSLGDKEAAKSMLDEVMNSGNDDQKAEASQMLDEL